MSYGLFLKHQTQPGRRDDVIAAWERHMPAAIAANAGHEAYVYTEVVDDPDALLVYQQYASADEAKSFLQQPAYLAYLADSEHLLVGPPELTITTPRWSKNVGQAGSASISA